MHNDKREVDLAARAWVDSFDQGGAGMPVADLLLRDPYDEVPTLELPLRELVGSELRYILRVDAAARAGGAAVSRDLYCGATPDAGEELRYVAARLDQLTSLSELSSGGVDRGWPADAAIALREAARAGQLLADLITYTTGRVLDCLDSGSIVALPVAGSNGVPNQLAVADCHRGSAEAIAGLLEDAAVRLAELSERIERLQHTANVVPGATQDDGPTLDTEAVLEWRLPGMVNQSRFHVRVFRPRGELPVVVIGNLADNYSQPITSAVEEVAAVVAEEMLGRAAHDSVRWVQLYPPGQLHGPQSESGLVQVVRFDMPYRRPRWLHRSQEQLEQLVGGAVRIWHSSDYTTTVMTNRGVPVLHPEARRYRPCLAG